MGQEPGQEKQHAQPGDTLAACQQGQQQENQRQPVGQLGFEKRLQPVVQYFQGNFFAGSAVRQAFLQWTG